MKPEVLGPKPVNDTTVVDPPYWCVKTASFKERNADVVRYSFEYNEQALLKKVNVYRIKRQQGEADTAFSMFEGDTISSNAISYFYNANKVVLIKKTGDDPSDNFEKILEYENGKIKSEITNVNLVSTIVTYTYGDSMIHTSTNYKSDVMQNRGSSTTYIFSLNSIFAETHHSTFADVWFKTKLDKLKKTIVIETRAFSDTVYLTNEENHFNPLVWELFQFFYSIPNGPGERSDLPNLPFNPYFVERILTKDISATYTYSADEKGRITGINRTVRGAPGRPYDPLPNEEFALTLTY